jgi:hypothetical protein
MGFLDKAKSLVTKHEDKIDDALEKVGDAVDKKTKGKHAGAIDKVVGKAQDLTPDADERRTEPPARP